MAADKVIAVGVGGGIAAYKAVEIVSRLVQAGHEVHVLMTEAAQQFVTATTFASVARRRAITRMFPDPSQTDGEDLYPHLFPATRAELFVVAPATADLMAKFAAGIADDVVCASALALPPACRRLFCPSMNTHMWQSDAVQGNVRRLEADGWRRIGPGHGTLACGVEGEGRMSEPADILSALEADLRDAASLAGRRVLILSGPTREPLDPVRYLGNASSGRMGRALALEALARGAEVEFVTGPVEPERLPRGPRLRIHPVGTAAEMLAEARPLAAQADVLVFAAAVADYAPARPAARKAAKSKAGATLALNPTPDIAATLAAKRRPGQVAIGFALETDAGAAKAAAKCRAKRLDGIVLNGPASMGADAAEFHYLAADAKSPEPWGRIEKGDCARRVLARAAELLAAR